MNIGNHSRLVIEEDQRIPKMNKGLKKRRGHYATSQEGYNEDNLNVSITTLTVAENGPKVNSKNVLWLEKEIRGLLDGELSR